MTKAELKDRLTKAIALFEIDGIGAVRYRRLVEAMGSATAVLETSIAGLAQISGVSRTTASAIKEKSDLDSARAIAARIVQLGWEVYFIEDDDYPTLLKEINDPPPILFRRGAAINPDEKMVAIVGTRTATERGRQQAYKLATSLAREGITVVSGMAEGIDSMAHRGALDAGGRTIAVWGTSLDIVYPSSNRDLAKDIADKGTILSEYYPGTAPDRATFPERNRIISGLSSGVVVVEAGKKSGALITATQALSQGRDLFAVPGSPDARMSSGTNELIRAGARLTTSVDDIFAELPRLKGAVIAKKFIQLPDMTTTEKNITNLLSDGGLQLDQLSRTIQLPVDELMGLLLALELKGVVKELSGKRYVLAENNQ